MKTRGDEYMNKKIKGFTLVELIVVLAILAILAAMLVPALTGYIDKANEKKVLSTARQYYIAAQSVVSDAYANGEEITNIIYLNNEFGIAKSIMTKNGGTSPITSSPYIDEFLNLAEITKDTTTIAISFVNSKPSEAIIGIANKLIILDSDGNLKVAD